MITSGFYAVLRLLLNYWGGIISRYSMKSRKSFKMRNGKNVSFP